MKTYLTVVFMFVLSVTAFAQYLSEPLGVGAGGQVHATCIDPINPDIFYIGTDVSGVLRSEDSGQSWEFWNSGLTNPNECKSFYIDDLKVIENRVYAATYGGIYSRDRVSGDWVLETPPETHSYSVQSSYDTRYYGTTIPFSTIAHDAGQIYAGAGTARSRTRWVLYPDTESAEYEGENSYEFVPYSGGPEDLYSLWKKQGTEWIADTSSVTMGMVRALDAKDGKVLLTGTNGVWLRDNDDPWIQLDTFYDLSVGGATNWGKWCWSARFADENTIYALADVRSGSDDVINHGVYRLELDSDDPSWELVGDPGEIKKPEPIIGHDYNWGQVFERGYVNRMTINILAEGVVELYIGERERYHEGGLYYLKILPEEDLGSLEWTHMICQRGNWNQNNVLYHYWDSINGSFEIITDKGWQDNDIIVSNCEVAINDSGDNYKLLAWQYSNGWLYNKDSSEIVVSNLYSEEQSGGWLTKGDNMLVCHDICSLEDGTLLVADDDYGVYRRDPGENGFEWLNWATNGDVKRDAFKIELVDETLFGIHHTKEAGSSNPDSPDDGAIRSNANQRRILSYFDESDPNDKKWIDAYDANPFQIVDFISLGSDEFLLAIRNKISGGPQESYVRHIHMDPDFGEYVMIDQSGVINAKLYELEAIPGTSLVALALHGYDDAGIKVIDIDEPGLEVHNWLSFDWQTTLGQCVREVHTLAADKSGSVLYIGTAGQSHAVNQAMPTTGTVLRITAPFSIAEPDRDRWEILANADGVDSFGMGDEINFYHSEGDEPWNEWNNIWRMTKITALEIDPNDPTIVFAGMSSSRFHPKNGIWRYEGGIWEHILGHGESFNEGVGAIEFDALDPSILYAGSNGGDIRSVEVPVSEPLLNMTKFTDRSNEVYQPTQPDDVGVKYTGHPYSEVLFDFDLDDDMDLLVTQTDGEVVLYEHRGYLIGNDPDYRKVDVDDFGAVIGFRGIAVADFSNDTEPARLGRGYPDIFLSHETDAMILQYINGDYVDVTDDLGVRDLIQNSWCGSWGDYNGDGQVDLFVGKGTGSNNDPFASDGDLGGIANVILRNDFQSSGTFIDVSSDILNSDIDNQTATVSASWVDIDNDNDMDLFVGDVGVAVSQGGPAPNNSALYINQGNGEFIENEEFRSALSEIEQVRGVVWTDCHSDFDLYFVIPSANDQYVLINDGLGYFDLQIRSGMSGSFSSLLIQDFNLDNHKDYLWLPYDQDQSVSFFWGQEGMSILELPDSGPDSGIDTTGPLFSATTVDLNEDGDMDLFIGDVTEEDNSYGKFYYRGDNIFETNIPLNDWVKICLIGDGGTNKSAIGAKVEATITEEVDKVCWQVVDGGNGLGRQHSSLLTFGLPPECPEEIPCTVIWPDGYRQDFTANHNMTTFVYDDSPPDIVSGSFSAKVYALPGSQTEWVFQWDTKNSSIPSEDRVFIEDVSGQVPGCQLGVDTLTPDTDNLVHAINRQADGSYRHTMIWHRDDCLAGCMYNATATSSTINNDGSLRDSSTAARPVKVSACLERPNIGN